MTTLREYYSAGLEALGAVRAPNRDAGGRIAYYRNEIDREGNKVYYFVGRSGGLRKGRCSSDSFSIQGTQSDAIILAKGKEKLNPVNKFAGF